MQQIRITLANKSRFNSELVSAGVEDVDPTFTVERVEVNATRGREQTNHLLSQTAVSVNSIRHGIGVSFFIGALALALSLHAASQATKIRAPLEPVPIDFFGMHIHHLWRPRNGPI